MTARGVKELLHPLLGGWNHRQAVRHVLAVEVLDTLQGVRHFNALRRELHDASSKGVQNSSNLPLDMTSARILYFTLMLPALMTFPHLAVSAAINLPNSVGPCKAKS